MDGITLSSPPLASPFAFVSLLPSLLLFFAFCLFGCSAKQSGHAKKRTKEKNRERERGSAQTSLQQCEWMERERERVQSPLAATAAATIAQCRLQPLRLYYCTCAYAIVRSESSVGKCVLPRFLPYSSALLLLLLQRSRLDPRHSHTADEKRERE